MVHETIINNYRRRMHPSTTVGGGVLALYLAGLSEKIISC